MYVWVISFLHCFSCGIMDWDIVDIISIESHLQLNVQIVDDIVFIGYLISN